MQHRHTCDHCVFHCDAPGCTAVNHTPEKVWTRAVKVIHDAGWRTETVKRGAEWKHLCPFHA